MELSKSNWDDCRKYLESTYIKVPTYGDKLFFVEQVDPSGILLKDQEEKLYKILLKEGSEAYVLPFQLSRKAAFQYKEHAYILERKPARQFFRGIHSENTRLLRVTSTGSFEQVPLCFEYLNAFINKPVYQTLGEIKNFCSIALSPKFLLSRNGYIYLNSSLVGHINRTKKLVFCHSLCRAEIEELINKSKGDSWQFQNLSMI